MRFVGPLGYDTKKVLRRLHKQSERARVRDRAQCVLLSEQGYTIPTLCKVFDVTQVTIYNWFNNWEERGLAGLYDKPGRGRKKKLSVELAHLYEGNQQIRVRGRFPPFDLFIRSLAIIALVTRNGIDPRLSASVFVLRK